MFRVDLAPFMRSSIMVVVIPKKKKKKKFFFFGYEIEIYSN